MTIALDRSTGYLLSREVARLSGSDFDEVLLHAHSVGASDIYLKSGRPIVARVHGRLVRLTQRPLDHTEVVTATCHMYGNESAEIQVRTAKPIDQAYSLRVDRTESRRFRWCATGVLANANFGVALVLRELSDIPPKFNREELGGELADALFPQDGLVFITGETGAGKSTRLASVVREMAEDPDSDLHILEFGHPIEYLFDKLSTVSCEIDQSAVPDHLGSFADAIRNSLRRDPDVIIVSESRDAETFKAAILAAQTGHTLYTTVHAPTVGSTFLRILQSLPHSESHSIIGSIIDQVKVIMSQRLVPSTDGCRCAVIEYLVFTDAMRRELLDVASTNLSLLPLRAQQLVEQHGQTMVSHARKLANQGLIDPARVRLLQQIEASSFQEQSTSESTHMLDQQQLQEALYG